MASRCKVGIQAAGLQVRTEWLLIKLVGARLSARLLHRGVGIASLASIWYSPPEVAVTVAQLGWNSPPPCCGPPPHCCPHLQLICSLTLLFSKDTSGFVALMNPTDLFSVP